MPIQTVEEAVQRMEAGFWRRYNANPDLQKKLAGKNRVIQLALTDGTGHWFQILEGKLAEVRPGMHAKPDAIVTIDRADLLAIFNGELKPMQAYLTGRIKVKASFGDLLFAKSLLGA